MLMHSFRKSHIAELCLSRLCSELIKAADGGQISVDWFDNDDSLFYPDPTTRPTVLLLPGLTGTSRESYILHMVQQSRDLGYRWVVLAKRAGCGPVLSRDSKTLNHGLKLAVHYYIICSSLNILQAFNISMQFFLTSPFLNVLIRNRIWCYFR